MRETEEKPTMAKKKREGTLITIGRKIVGGKADLSMLTETGSRKFYTETRHPWILQ